MNWVTPACSVVVGAVLATKGITVYDWQLYVVLICVNFQDVIRSAAKH